MPQMTRSIVGLLSEQTQTHHIVMVEEWPGQPRKTEQLPNMTLIQIKRKMSAEKWKNVLFENKTYTKLGPWGFMRIANTLPAAAYFAIPLTLGRLLLVQPNGSASMVICCRYCMRQNAVQFYCKCCGLMPVAPELRFCSHECMQNEVRFRK
jgi:hypothetical protein